MPQIKHCCDVRNFQLCKNYIPILKLQQKSKSSSYVWSLIHQVDGTIRPTSKIQLVNIDGTIQESYRGPVRSPSFIDT